MEIKTIELFDKPLFNLVTIEEIVHMPTRMPDNEAAFVFVLQGECISYSEVEEIHLGANQAVLAKCGNSTFRTITVNGSSVYRALTIKFHKEVLEELYKNSTSPFMKNVEHPLLVNSTIVETNQLIKQYVNGLVLHFDNQDLLSEDLLLLKLKELIVLLLQTENAPKVLGIMNNLFEKKTFKFKEIIKSHICSSLSIEELAQLTSHSLSSFKKEFNRIYNDTPNNYLIGQRIELAAKSLLSTNTSISSIAYDCEFKTLAHMSRVFKTKYGIAPSEYRQNFSDKR
ncbi:MAG: helix-turn-helix transcriptional regulator [Flavobacteriales bacterium]|nr:helix-turn-helix transcriptional regulator [Flavobacteriales bacterium]